MLNINHATSLYNYLRECNLTGLDKKVLDCGAGGNFPPLSLFYEQGYECYGIDISDKQIQKAEKFCIQNKMDIKIQKGDMRNIPFSDNFFNFVYFYNSIHHMSKEDIAIAMKEIDRVTKPDGLCFANFPSASSWRFGKGEKVGEGEYIQKDDGEKCRYCFYEDDEADNYFINYDIIRKEKRIVQLYIDGKRYTQAFIDYIVKKMK